MFVAFILDEKQMERLHIIKKQYEDLNLIKIKERNIYTEILPKNYRYNRNCNLCIKQIKYNGSTTYNLFYEGNRTYLIKSGLIDFVKDVLGNKWFIIEPNKYETSDDRLFWYENLAMYEEELRKASNY